MLDERDREVHPSQVKEGHSYRLAEVHESSEMRIIHWGDQSKKIFYRSPREFWGQITRWAGPSKALMNEEEVEIPLSETRKGMKLHLLPRNQATMEWHGKKCSVVFNYFDGRNFWKNFREQFGINGRDSGWRFELGQ
jgi:hypothetical protein